VKLLPAINGVEEKKKYFVRDFLEVNPPVNQQFYILFLK